MGPVKEVLTLKECLVNPVKDHCRPVSASLLIPIAYFMYSTVPICQTFYLVAIQMCQNQSYPLFGSYCILVAHLR